MAMAGRDPLFWAALDVANQDDAALVDEVDLAVGRDVEIVRIAQPRVVQIEAQRAHQMEARPRIRAKSYDIPGVRGDFGLVQDHLEH